MHVSRLRKFEPAEMSEPLPGPAPRLIIQRGGASLRAKLLEQNAVGLVKLHLEDPHGGAWTHEWVDLTKEEYHWVDG